MHVWGSKIMIHPPQYTPEKLGFGIISFKSETSRNSLFVPILGLSLPKAVPSLAVFAWKPFAGNAHIAVVRDIMQFGQLLPTQKLTKNPKNQWTPNISLFPLIPTRATTTKLAQKLENIQYPWKPSSTSQLLRRQNVEDMILALLDPIWLCLNMCPALQGGNPCSAACAQLITAAYLSLEKTMPVSFCQTLFRNPLYISLSSWNNMFFFDVQVCQNNTLFFWGMLTGVYP